MRGLGDGRFQNNSGRVTLAAANPAATPLQQAVDVGLDWAGRAKRPVAILILHLSRLHAPGPRPHHRRIASALRTGRCKPMAARCSIAATVTSSS